MRHNIYLIILLFCSFAQGDPLQDTLKDLDWSQAISFYAKDITHNKVIIDFHGSRSQPPASTLKLITATLALTNLGPNYQFKTSLNAYGKIKKSKLDGFIEITFGGDPKFSRFTLRKWFKQLKKSGISTIKGNINLIDPPSINPPGRLSNELNDCYGRMPSSASIDQNCSIIKVEGTQQNVLANLVTNTRTEGLINNQVTSTRHCRYQGDEPSAHLIFHDKTAILNLYQDNKAITLTGCIHPKHFPVQVTIAPPKNSFLKNQILDALKRNNMTLQGNIRIIPKPLGTQKQAILHKQQKSMPVKTLLKRLLLNSDNHIAEALYYGSTQNKIKQPYWLNAEKNAKTTLKTLGLNFSNAAILDGSGLSRYNHIQTKQMVQLLEVIYKSPKLRPYILKYLPASGRTGTLSYRFRHPNLRNIIQAKTGTLKDVLGLSGYLTHQQRIIAFSMALDGNKNSYGLYMSKENKLFNNLLNRISS
ncbi:MAG TPA: D-alanyl-D-alanine carboxypeptidase/D-alanyl-D-alanine-endopeptidase [Gammaproteobacteria bacterium]|nr:D-alanyl-D-alanine carboxypeptidase/D-alanyl-D-alanine-endopeptidase [Gammaproteobacteria bacterium]